MYIINREKDVRKQNKVYGRMRSGNSYRSFNRRCLCRFE